MLRRGQAAALLAPGKNVLGLGHGPLSCAVGALFQSPRRMGALSVSADLGLRVSDRIADLRSNFVSQRLHRFRPPLDVADTEIVIQFRREGNFQAPPAVDPLCFPPALGADDIGNDTVQNFAVCPQNRYAFVLVNFPFFGKFAAAVPTCGPPLLRKNGHADDHIRRFPFPVRHRQGDPFLFPKGLGLPVRDSLSFHLFHIKPGGPRHVQRVVEVDRPAIQKDFYAPLNKFSVGAAQVVGEPLAGAVQPVASRHNDHRTAFPLQPFRAGRVFLNRSGYYFHILILDIIQVNKSIQKGLVPAGAGIYLNTPGQRDTSQSHSYAKTSNPSHSSLGRADGFTQNKTAVQNVAVHAVAVVGNDDLRNAVHWPFFLLFLDLLYDQVHMDVCGTGLHRVINDFSQPVFCRVVIVAQRLINLRDTNEGAGRFCLLFHNRYLQ